MKQKTIQKELSEEELILSNPEMMARLRETQEAEKKGIKGWKLKLPEEMSEEEAILSNPEMAKAIKETKEAQKRGVKGWELKF